MKKIILVSIIIVSFVECLKYDDLCFPRKRNDFICSGKHSYNCAEFICSRNQYTCQLLSLFSASKGIRNKNNYGSFIDKIQSCPIQLYKWNTSDVCLKSKDCSSNLIDFEFRRWRNHKININVHKCKCTGKYKYLCKSDYCGLNKPACDGLKKNIVGIQKCI